MKEREAKNRMVALENRLMEYAKACWTKKLASTKPDEQTGEAWD